MIFKETIPSNEILRKSGLKLKYLNPFYSILSKQDYINYVIYGERKIYYLTEKGISFFLSKKGGEV